MTNTELLKKKIESSGLKVCFIAENVGITRQLLWKKVNNIRPFNQYEIEKMCKILNIESLEEKETIFFANNVD